MLQSYRKGNDMNELKSAGGSEIQTDFFVEKIDFEI